MSERETKLTDMALTRQWRSRIRKAQRRVGFSNHSRRSVRIEEASGMRVSVSSDLPHAAEHAASVFEKHYIAWRDGERYDAWGQYKREHFTVAVGGGNTIKAQFQAMIDRLHGRVNWMRHVRFFVVEDSTGEGRWESPEHSLSNYFIKPLVRKLIVSEGLRALVRKLELPQGSNEDDIVDTMKRAMIVPMDLSAARSAKNAGKKAQALRLARAEAERYQRKIRHRLGEKMAFHFLISGIGKDGSLGALSPYLPELTDTDPGVIVIKRPSGALRVALNRGAMAGAERISLIVSGSLKLRALGRMEMEETTDFEQTVLETPIRMLRASEDIARRVTIFADEQSLHFDETIFQYTENGQARENKAETREGEDPKGPHVLLLHGFMGLFSFASFLIRLPSAWTVSALHRGRFAKTLAEDDIFPHYAQVLRKAILKLWKQGRPAPIAGHSIAGIIIDHLLLSLLDDYDADIKPYNQLRGDDRRLVDALRVGGIVNLATWAPSDGPHAGANIRNAVSHYRDKTELDYSGFDQVYERHGNDLALLEEASVYDEDRLASLDRFLRSPVSEPLVNAINSVLRQLLNNKSVQQRMLNVRSPYILRLVGSRLLKTVSFYGMFKEVNAALHDPVEYQRRHLKALDVILAYDIPVLHVVHNDDFLVCAQRHREEHRYLLSRRKKRENVTREQDLQVTTRLLVLNRAAEDLPLDPLNPHLLIMATSKEGNTMAREITGAMTTFVNENLEKAIQRRRIKAIPSVRTWRAKHPVKAARKPAR